MSNVENDLQIILNGGAQTKKSKIIKPNKADNKKDKKSVKSSSKTNKHKSKPKSKSKLSREKPIKKDEFSLREPVSVLKYNAADENPEYVSARTEKPGKFDNAYIPYTESVIRRLEKSKVDKYVDATEDEE